MKWVESTKVCKTSKNNLTLFDFVIYEFTSVQILCIIQASWAISMNEAKIIQRLYFKLFDLLLQKVVQSDRIFSTLKWISE